MTFKPINFLNRNEPIGAKINNGLQPLYTLLDLAENGYHNSDDKKKRKVFEKQIIYARKHYPELVARISLVAALEKRVSLLKSEIDELDDAIEGRDILLREANRKLRGGANPKKLSTLKEDNFKNNKEDIPMLPIERIELILQTKIKRYHNPKGWHLTNGMYCYDTLDAIDEIHLYAPSLSKKVILEMIAKHVYITKGKLTYFIIGKTECARALNSYLMGEKK